MFSEGKSPVEVAIALDEPGDRVRVMYREYWELSGRYELAQIYDEARYDLRGLLRLNKIVKDLGLNERDIIKVLELAKYNELQNLQWKVEYLRNEVNMLENEKWESTNQILKLNRMIDEFQSSLAQKRGEMANMNQETGCTITLVTPIPHTQNHILIHILFSYLIAIFGRRNKSAVQQIY